MHTGRSVGGHPSLGSWINYGLGSENRNLPGYVLLHGGTIPPGGLESFSNGYLPATHQAMPIRAEGAPIDNIVPADKDARVQRAKLDALLQQDLGTTCGPSGPKTGSNRPFITTNSPTECSRWYRMFSISTGKTKRPRSLYGLETKDKNKHLYSQQCLRARRLVEAGVRFVEVTCSGSYSAETTARDRVSPS